ncbi:MerR family transcriptional regulator [Iodobacter sp.]|uniref:MerR family transcriptional regulator n=1 Tax=Iodobacter sp. TaxID=1915058 RepID=UPI0025F6FB02|nr:MerR family transcriptional regulator [Iodobacter sp.]
MTLSISKVSEHCGLSIDTLRYYEKIGLIDTVPRGLNGQRRYRDEDLGWIAFLLRLRSTGMGIVDMQRYASLRRAGHTPDSLVPRREMLEAHAAAVALQIASLQENLLLLQGKIEIYRQMEASFSST